MPLATMPLVINDNLERLVQINMQGSVGQGGNNLQTDVQMVQAMLNNVPSGDGGPSPLLKVDGKVGPMTIAAIMRFQRASKRKVVDGRIDPLGPTITALGQLLNQRNLMPSVPGIGSADERVVRGLTATTAAAPPSRFSVGEREPQTGLGIPGVSPTDWKFASSSGVSIGALIFGVAAMNFFLVRDREPNRVRTFPWSGFGVGLSTTPVGFDVSFKDFPSFGLQLRQGIFGSNPMPEEDIAGPCTVYSFGANLGVGASGTLCMFGSLGPVLLTTRAIGFIVGMEVGIPNVGITGFFGLTGKAVN